MEGHKYIHVRRHVHFHTHTQTHTHTHTHIGGGGRGRRRQTEPCHPPQCPPGLLKLNSFSRHSEWLEESATWCSLDLFSNWNWVRSIGFFGGPLGPSDDHTWAIFGKRHWRWPPALRVWIQKRHRVYVQNVPVCTRTTRTCVSTCARVAGTHGSEGHAKKCVERCCELANKTTQQLYKVSTPCIDDHHFKEEELKSVGDLSKVCSQIVLKCLYLARIGRPDILLSVNKLAQSIKNGPKLVTHDCLVWSLTFIIHVPTNSIVMWDTLRNTAGWDCFQPVGCVVLHFATWGHFAKRRQFKNQKAGFEETPRLDPYWKLQLVVGQNFTWIE